MRPRSSATDPSPQKHGSLLKPTMGQGCSGLQKVMFQGSGVLDTWMTVPGSVRPETPVGTLTCIMHGSGSLLERTTQEHS